ncbi:tRNA 2-selenouridine(34) synthase MnmH [Dehalobacter sp. DCM]|uniref:tRNA 2-selenouridine(34) synthase MnmH n=1 Tax=Dehalobacter sp. DCM TaxID=2907827 RepID=UPI003081CB83|nr:tRNA 2-selenouridine(34) synthase MnmH [Dehalobacter sp. DCM]
MLQDILVEELSKLADAVYIDVRSEHEYSDGTIPGAVNVPIFNNEERAQIGTIYSQESPKKAMELGLEIASRKLPVLYKQVEEIAGKKPILMFCWRGGMRSKSVAAVLDVMGLHVYRLTGGYKAYRQKVVSFFENECDQHIVVIKGNTGAGKTELLAGLKEHGYPVIDLEGLSNNRGSVFGHIGLGTQPSQKQFESMLYDEIERYKDYSYLIMECESRRIGRVSVPGTVFQAMQEGTNILLYDTLENRAKRLCRVYTENVEMMDELQAALERLKKTIGKVKLSQLNELLSKKAYTEFAQYLIADYYDHLYGYPNEKSEAFSLSVSHEAPQVALREVEQFLDENFAV